jgi:hypothetical protein
MVSRGVELADERIGATRKGLTRERSLGDAYTFPAPSTDAAAAWSNDAVPNWRVQRGVPFAS